MSSTPTQTAGRSKPRSGFVVAFQALRQSENTAKLLAMMGLSFLVVFMIGVVRPIKDALALDGLAAGDFYQVYFVSAVVVLFVPIYNRFSKHFAWRHLIPGVAIFFAFGLVFFRLIYIPGSTAFGLVFYGWYDLMAAVLVTQFYMATQVFFNAREAKRAYPVVIAAASVGAAVGGGITAFFSERVGAANLLLVGAAAIVLFAVGTAIVWAREDPDLGRPDPRDEDPDLSTSEFKRVFSDPQVRLIALTVLLMVLVKQFIDYEYKELSAVAFEDPDELGGFFGLIDAVTQWLPIVVLVALRPILHRWGAGVGVLIFPAAMIAATGAMALSMTLAVAVVARTGEKMFRYSAERTGREILYVPVPNDVKLRAKAYIDVAVEKGVGKALSGALLAVPALLLSAVDVLALLRVVALVGLGLAVVLLFVFLRARKEYVQSLARSFEGRFASFGGTYVSLSQTGALDMARSALRDPRPLKVAFALDVVADADEHEIELLAPELHGLLGHEAAEIRARALEVLSQVTPVVRIERIRPFLEDENPEVRRQAVQVLAAAGPEPPAEVLARLLERDDRQVREATLACLAHDLPASEAEPVARAHFDRLRASRDGEDPAHAEELAVAAGVVPHHPDVIPTLRELMSHPEAVVANAAIRSAGRIEGDALTSDLIRALGAARTRVAARRALGKRGDEVVGQLITALNDPETDLWIRRGVASALGEISSRVTVDALIASYLLPETEQALDDRTLAALRRLRSRDRRLEFPPDRVNEAVDRELKAARRYARAEAAVALLEPSRAQLLLRRALDDARKARTRSVFHWLGLLHAQREMWRSWLVLSSEDGRRRANALEWMESTVGHTLFTRIQRVWQYEPAEADREDVASLLRDLWDDEDVWIARCALWTSLELEEEAILARLSDYAPTDPGLVTLVERLRSKLDGGAVQSDRAEANEEDMDLIEKVFLLQGVDLLRDVPSQQLALLASIAREIDADENRVVIEKGEPTDALFVVLRGEVVLEGMGDQGIVRSEGESFGTWALIDGQPSMVEARATRPSRLLRISRIDFQDLLVDHPELGLDLLRGLARRVRTLATP